MSSDTENLTLIFHLDLTSLSEPWETLENIFFACESQHCYPYQQKAMEQVKDRLLSLSYVLFSKEISEVNEAAARIVDELMECLCKYFNWYTYESQDEYVNPEAYQRFYRILAYCGEHYNEKVTVSQLAEIEHIMEKTDSVEIIAAPEAAALIKQHITCWHLEKTFGSSAGKQKIST